MSRSFKKSPVVSPASSKEFNSKANRRLRHRVRILLLDIENSDSILLPLPREVSNIYDSPKDGRCNMFGTPKTGDEGAGLKKFMRK